MAVKRGIHRRFHFMMLICSKVVSTSSAHILYTTRKLEEICHFVAHSEMYRHIQRAIYLRQMNFAPVTDCGGHERVCRATLLNMKRGETISIANLNMNWFNRVKTPKNGKLPRGNVWIGCTARIFPHFPSHSRTLRRVGSKIARGRHCFAAPIQFSGPIARGPFSNS